MLAWSKPLRLFFIHRRKQPKFASILIDWDAVQANGNGSIASRSSIAYYRSHYGITWATYFQGVQAELVELVGRKVPYLAVRHINARWYLLILLKNSLSRRYR